MKRLLFAMMIFLFTVGLSSAEVYRWVDEKGEIHFTDDLSQIPEKYRPAAEETNIQNGVESPKLEEPSASATKDKEDTYKDALGNGEDYWKGRVAEWKKKLKDSQEKLEALRLKYNELTEQYNDSRVRSKREIITQEREKIRDSMGQCKVDIEKSMEMLEKKIPEEAELYKAKPEWLSK